MISRRQKLLLAFGLLLSALVLAACVFHYQARWAVARYQRQLLAGGEKLKLEEVLPPPVLPESNGAPIFRQTIGTWNKGTNLLEHNPPWAMHLVAPGKAMVGWKQPDIRLEGTNTWQEAEAALAQYGDNLEVAREAAERPVFDFHLDYRQGFTLLLPHLAPLKSAVQRLMTAALCDLHEGRGAEASTNVQAMLALVRATADERLAISQLVRIAMAHLAVAATWELLHSPNVPGERLAAIQRDWENLKFIEPALKALTLERAMSQMMLERMRSSGANFRQVVAPGNGGFPNFGAPSAKGADAILAEIVVGAKEARWRMSLSYPDQLRALKGYQALLDSLRLVQGGEPFNRALSRQQARLAELGLRPATEDFGRIFDPSGPDLRYLFSESVVALSRLLNRVLAAEAARQLSVTALALERFHLLHNRYPADLSELVPDLLPAIPRDPADGQSLRYQLQPDGAFTLYSIGEDGIDNGGDSSPAGTSDNFGWQKGRDLVWPKPATEAEVNKSRQKESAKRSR